MAPILLTGLVRISETIVIFTYIYRMEGHWRSIGWHQINSGMYYGCIWSLAFGIIVFILFFLCEYLFQINLFRMVRMPLPESYVDQINYFIVGCLIGPFTEEVVFRGVVYGFFRKWGIVLACCFSTCIFVLLHHQAPVIPFTQIVGGILFAVSYEYTHMLSTSVTIHIIGNSSMLLLSYFPINL